MLSALRDLGIQLVIYMNYPVMTQELGLIVPPEGRKSFEERRATLSVVGGALLPSPHPFLRLILFQGGRRVRMLNGSPPSTWTQQQPLLCLPAGFKGLTPLGYLTFTGVPWRCGRLHAPQICRGSFHGGWNFNLSCREVKANTLPLLPASARPGCPPSSRCDEGTAGLR